ncbi:AB-hydrolase YheT [Amylocystis lapponica]|nr:AB-hydrolase YheT [Amylocystis lapponica]
MGVLFSLMPAAYFLPQLFFAPSPESLSVRTSPASKEVKQVSLRQFVEARCPSLFRPFRPAWWLFSGHLQTAYCVMGDFSKVDKVEYDRIIPMWTVDPSVKLEADPCEIILHMRFLPEYGSQIESVDSRRDLPSYQALTLLRTLDGGTIGLDSTPPENERILPDDTPIVVVLHGLTGGSHESYVRSILAPVCTPVEQGGLGYRGIVVNFRGCAGVPLTSPQLYSAGYTDDIRVAVMHISTRYPRARLVGLGFSLGANVLTRYLGEEGEHSRLVAGCILACPWDLLANNEQLVTSWFHRNVYARGMGQNLVKLIKRHAHIASAFPAHPFSAALPRALAMRSPVLEDFDNAVTRIGGGPSPPFPFATARKYYVWASSDRKLRDVRVPLLALNAADDPIVQVVPVDAGNGWVVIGVTKGGGHLGWFEAGGRRVKRWMSRPVVEWIRAVAEDLVVEGLEGRVKPLHEVDGFLKEEGRDDIGCKVADGGGHVVGVEGEGGLFAGL